MSLFSTPLRALIFALSGAALAWLWYNTHFVIPIATVAVIWILGTLIEKYGLTRLPDHPVKALKLFEFRVIAIAALTAATAAVAIVIGVEVTAPGRAEGDSVDVAAQKEAIKAIVSSVAAALAAFVAALTIKAEDADEKIGSSVKDYFYAAYDEDKTSPKVYAENTRPRREGAKMLLPRESPGLLAVFSNYGGKITDWTRDNRAKRAQILEEYLRSYPPD